MPLLTEVDRLEVQVLVDNVTTAVLSTPAFVTREWPALGAPGHASACRGRRCLRQPRPVAGAPRHRGGRAAHAAVRRRPGRLRHRTQRPRVSASTSAPSRRWCCRMAIGITAAVCSRRSRLMRAAAPRKKIPIWLHPGMFAERGQRQPDGGVLPAALLPTPDELAEAGAAPEVTRAPQCPARRHVLPERRDTRVTTYETGLRNQVRRTAHGEWEPDPLIMDERFLAVAVKDKGIVVFTACSHAGVVNVLTHARQCFPDRGLYAVMGGFHLSGRNRALHSGNRARHRGLRPERDRTRPLHRLARAEQPRADLRRRDGGASRCG